MLKLAEKQRREVHGVTPRSHKSAMGQFMTPAGVASFMAGLFRQRDGEFRLLDAGAGLGALTCATLDRWLTGEMGQGGMSVEVHELDDRLRGHLEETLARYHGNDVSVLVKSGDFLAHAADDIQNGRAHFTHAILNPPYKKINADSDARMHARRAGLETVNLYSAFVGLALSLLGPGGQLVAIVPRSFCNGPYYKPFRRHILSKSALQRVHLFDSRKDAFKDDDVLQENVILLLQNGAMQGDVVISQSRDDSFADTREQAYPFAAVVKPGDPECFIHVPGDEEDPLDASPLITASLKDLGISVSTGPIVDFRAIEHLRTDPTSTSVPLLYPQHFDHHRTVWPIEGKKPNAIERNDETDRDLWPCGNYVVVRRFSSKEERRRVVASMVRPQALGNPERIAFENHLNVFHDGKKGLPENLAWGLFVYLNSTAVDEHLRRFSGHTQVNATDLKNIRYPVRDDLEAMGAWARQCPSLEQEEIDSKMAELMAGKRPGSG
jgi:adenine-specific DNA-methyltransferase